MGMSVQYHLLNDMCPVSSFYLRLDYAGIVLVITVSGLSKFYYAFYCEPFY